MVDNFTMTPATLSSMETGGTYLLVRSSIPLNVTLPKKGSRAGFVGVTKATKRDKPLFLIYLNPTSEELGNITKLADILLPSLLSRRKVIWLGTCRISRNGPGLRVYLKKDVELGVGHFYLYAFQLGDRLFFSFRSPEPSTRRGEERVTTTVHKGRGAKRPETRKRG